MTIYRTILEKGYFPKELPPFFRSSEFARYATTKSGRTALKSYALPNKFAECATYTLALPGLDHRSLKIPHPKTFASLVQEVSKNFRRLLRKAGTSNFSRSRPVYSTQDHRAIRTLVDPANLSRERSLSRGGSSFLLRADVSQFYPSLYTHAVGWSVDPKLREKANWQNSKLLGKRLDQLLMNMQGKVSQGIPIGNDVSFLLAEIVLGQVDKELRDHADRAFRWFDDYEVACDSRSEAEAVLSELRAALAKYNLRLNPKKTTIVELPLSTSDTWQNRVLEASQNVQLGHRQMLRFFDTVFELRASHAGTPILLYAMGLLFKVPKPSLDVLRVAESCISQALLCEPGCAQKAFALLNYWALNGATLSHNRTGQAIERMIQRHETVGATSDISWALAFCISQKIRLPKTTAKVLSTLDDDCVAIQSLHAHAAGVLPTGFSTKGIEGTLRNASLDGPHWLALYESVRQNFLPGLAPVVKSDALFGDMLRKDVAFYRQSVPAFATVVHQGGAPQWILRAWLASAAPSKHGTPAAIAPPEGALAEMLKDEAAKVAGEPSFAELIANLLGTKEPDAATDGDEPSTYG